MEIELGEFLTDYDSVLNGEINSKFESDVIGLINNQVRELYERVYDILSNLNLICWCMHNKFNHEYQPFIHRFYLALQNEIDDINRFPILYKYIEKETGKSIDEIYASAIFYKEYNFPDTLKEFVKDNKYMNNFIERYRNNDNGK